MFQVNKAWQIVKGLVKGDREKAASDLFSMPEGKRREVGKQQAKALRVPKTIPFGGRPR